MTKAEERKAINEFKDRLFKKMDRALDALDKEYEEGASEEVRVEIEMLEVWKDVIKRTR